MAEMFSFLTGARSRWVVIAVSVVGLLCLGALLQETHTDSLPTSSAHADDAVAPVARNGLGPNQTLESVLNNLCGVPYRVDGASTIDGRHTLFANESKTFSTPGYNCSGFVLEASRKIFGTVTTIAQAKRDRENNSGPKSADGHDWDFGWDLIRNITDGMPRALFIPGGTSVDPTTQDGFKARGYDLHSSRTWQELKSRIQKNHVYFLSYNRETEKRGYRLMHYHVGLVVLAENGDMLMYQTTPQSRRSYVRNLSNPKEMEEFLSAFSNAGVFRKYITVLEVPLAVR